MEILELYKSILTSGNATVGDEGHVSVTVSDDDPIPFRIDGARLTLPTDDHLRAGSFNPDSGMIAFHPICESVALEQSIVYRKFEDLLQFRLSAVLRELILQLALIAQDKKAHSKLSPSERGLLMAMPNADADTYETIRKIVSRASAQGNRKICSLYVRRGGSYAGADVSRLGRFVPSIAMDLDETARELWGVTIRKQDLPAVVELFEYILPDYKDVETYSRPSNSQVAPNLHALLRTFMVVAKRLNRVIELHRDNLDGADDLLIPLDWIDAINDLSVYRARIPTLPGNDGQAKAGGNEAARPVQAVTTQAPPREKLSERLASRSAPQHAPGSVESVLAGLTGQRRRTIGSDNTGRSRRWGLSDPNEPDLPPWVEDDRDGLSGAGRRWDGSAGSARGRIGRGRDAL